jgi:hypothetical protein
MLISLLHIHATKQANKLTKQTPQKEEWKQKDEYGALEATQISIRRYYKLHQASHKGTTHSN